MIYIIYIPVLHCMFAPATFRRNSIRPASRGCIRSKTIKTNIKLLAQTTIQIWPWHWHITNIINGMNSRPKLKIIIHFIRSKPKYLQTYLRPASTCDQIYCSYWIIHPKSIYKMHKMWWETCYEAVRIIIKYYFIFYYLICIIQTHFKFGKHDFALE